MHWRIFWGGAGGCAPPQLHSCTPPTCFAPPQHLLAPPQHFCSLSPKLQYKGSSSICSSKLFVFTASDHAWFDISDALRYILGLQETYFCAPRPLPQLPWQALRAASVALARRRFAPSSSHPPNSSGTPPTTLLWIRPCPYVQFHIQLGTTQSPDSGLQIIAFIEPFA